MAIAELWSLQFTFILKLGEGDFSSTGYHNMACMYVYMQPNVVW